MQPNEPKSENTVEDEQHIPQKVRGQLRFALARKKIFNLGHYPAASRRFGISFHPEHVRKLLKRRLHGSSPRPPILAKECADEGVARGLA
jgi:hypothetical protein